MQIINEVINEKKLKILNLTKMYNPKNTQLYREKVRFKLQKDNMSCLKIYHFNWKIFNNIYDAR